MSPEIIGLIGVAVLIILIFMKVWLGLAMSIVGFIGFMLIKGFDLAALMAGTEPYSQIADLTLTTIPLFIFMGAIISSANLGADLFESASKWVGRVRGGLASATVVACGAFAAVCGHTSASAITIGKVALPEMKKYNYNEKLASATCVAGGSIGIMIPPSIALILYGLLTQESVGKLFLAGFLPGILQVVFYIIMITIVSRIKPDWAPSTGVKHSFKEKVVSLKLTLPIALIFLIAIGGIYLGLFTPTEAGAMGAFGALVISLLYRRLKVPQFKQAILETIMTTAMIVFMMAGAYIFMRFITVSGLPALLVKTITNAGLSRFSFMVVIVIFYLLAGCVLDVFAVIILTVPIFMPTINALGFDPIWFGIIIVRLIQIGLMTPPIGMDVFTFGGAMGIKTGPIFRGVVPFVITDFIHLGLLLAIPEITMLLLR